MDPSVREAHTKDRRAQQALYEKEGYVGEGAFGVVMKAVVKQQPGASAPSSATYAKKYVAIKQMMNQREGQGISQDAYREIKILKELRHENIVSLDRIFTRPDKHEVDLVYEYADHDLAEIIKFNRIKTQANPNILPDARFVKSVLQQILTGLAFLHKNWCMHRDMKPANILVTGLSTNANISPEEDLGGRVKIADFGLARIFQSPLRKLSDDGEVVTIWYRAPELLLGSKHYTRAIDIFAVGCIFYELLVSSPLFPGSELKGGKVFQENQVRCMFQFLGKPTPEQWKGMVDCPYYPHIKNWQNKDYSPNSSLPRLLHNRLSPQGLNLLHGLLAYDPGVRLTADQALAHPYFREEPKPDRNVFRDIHGGLLSYPPRQGKPINAAKRVREEPNNNNSQLQQPQHQQQPAAMASQAASSAAQSTVYQQPQLQPTQQHLSLQPQFVALIPQQNTSIGYIPQQQMQQQQQLQQQSIPLQQQSMLMDELPALSVPNHQVIAQRFQQLQQQQQLVDAEIQEQINQQHLQQQQLQQQQPPQKVRRI